MAPQVYGAPRLPKELLNRIQPNGTTSSSPYPRKRTNLSRRDQRKETRQQNKKGARPQQPRAASKPQDDAGEDFIEDAWASEKDDDELEPPQKRVKLSPEPKKLKSILKSFKPDETSPAPSPPPRMSRVARDALQNDDAEIAILEKKLGMKGKKRSKAFEDDGLDDLLEGIDHVMGTGKKKLRNDDNEWLKQKRKKSLDAAEEENDSVDSDSFGESSSDESRSSEDDGFREDLDDMSHHGQLSSEEAGDIFSESDILGEEDEIIEDHQDNGTPSTRVKENPYRPPISSSTIAAPKYIPPSLRGLPQDDQQLIVRIRRQLQGLLNRLTETNLLSILRDFEGVLSNNPRHHVISTLTELLIGLVSDRTALMDTFIILHAAFIAAVYKVIGTHFGAPLVERVVTDFNRYYKTQKRNYDGSKEATNLIALLAEMYTFQVISCNIIFDLIRLLLSDLSEVDTELLLKLIKNCGPQLRTDDPLALKDIVVLVQKAVAAKGGEEQFSVRTKFMIETITNLKNNKLRTGIPGSIVASDHALRFNKTLKSQNFKTTEPLGFGLKDIENADKSGKWWLVGASWRTNNQESEKASSREAPITTVGHGELENDRVTTYGSIDLLALAKEHRMNTGIRRTIFITIMSSVDYKDAWLRLRRLRLSKSQQFEIPRILVYLAGAEQNYNPYYRLVAKKLCSEHKFRKALQFNLWRIFKRCGEKDNVEDDDGEEDVDEDSQDTKIQLREIVSLAKFFGELIAGRSLPITTLKILNFVYLQEQTTSLLEVLFVTIFQAIDKSSKSQEQSRVAIMEIFSTAKESPDMVPGLQYFLKNSIKSSSLIASSEDRKALKRNCRAAVDAVALVEFSGTSV